MKCPRCGEELTYKGKNKGGYIGNVYYCKYHKYFLFNDSPQSPIPIEL